MQASEVVHVIDDDEGVREGLCALLDAKGYVAQPHASCEEFLNGFSANAALCVVADLRMPGMGGLDLQTHLLKNSIDLPFIVITGHGDVSSAVRALKSGAADFIEKPIDGKSFIAAVERAVVARRANRTQLEAAHLAHERVPAVLITGLGDPDIRARAERAGVAAFFDKPIDPPVLFSALTRLLSEAHV